MRLSPNRLLCAAILLLTLLLVSFVTRLLFGQRGFDILPENPNANPVRSRPNAPDVQYGEECAPFRAGALDDVTIVLKLGAGQVATQLPAYISRLSRCTQNVLLFSDRKADYGGFDIVDALANLRPEYKYNNPDFEVYDEIQHAVVLDAKTTERLDKYKFLPMIELAEARRPKSNWFLFLELETYVNWDNMQRFLASFDPMTPYYFGSPVWPRKKPVFAHSGSGFVLSRGAFNKLMARGRMFAENHHSPGTHLFGKDVRKECCGDEVLAKVLKESGISIHGYWPMFNGESPSSIRFNWEQWCEAILTLHQVQPDEFASMERWEVNRAQRSKPLTFDELFTHIEPGIQERREDWTNLSEDITYTGKRTAGKSWESCRAACSRVHRCMQYEHFGETCRLSRSIRLGHELPASSGAKHTSGWMAARIQSFKTKHTKKCHGAHFPHANPH